MDPEQIVQNLRELRMARDLTQTQLSLLADVSLSQIRLIEKGHCNPTAATLRRLSEALGLTGGPIHTGETVTDEQRMLQPLLLLLRRFPPNARPEAVRFLCASAAALLSASKTLPKDSGE